MLEIQRQQINQLDQAIVELLERRFAVAADVAKIKYQAGLPVLDTQREALVLEQVSEQLNDKTLAQLLIPIYQSILSSSRQHQYDLIKNWQQEVIEHNEA